MAKRERSKLAEVLDEVAKDPKVRAVAASAAVAAGGLAAGKVVRDRSLERAENRETRAYRLFPGETVAAGVRRIARGALDHAIELLEASAGDDLPEAIHEARKTLKRLRALVRLARDALGEETYRLENQAFRDAGRELSSVRDAQVTVDTLEGLRTRFGEELPADAFAGLHAALRDDARTAHERVRDDSQALAELIDSLSAARSRVATWPLRDDDGLQVLRPGFGRIYRRGRRAMNAVRKETSTERLHELRKRAKDLWHAAQVLRPIAPKRMKWLRRRAHRLADVVGEDHDLSVLLDRARERSDTLAPGELELLAALVERRRNPLQREAIKQGRRLYAQKPRQLVRLIPTAHTVAS
jgi:CHAD domain-containing protein